MKKGKPRSKRELFRPRPGHHHGTPPADMPPECFYLIDDASANGELWFYAVVAPHIETIFDVGADTTFYKNFSHGTVHYFEPITDSNIFAAEKKSKTMNRDIFGNKKSYFNNFGLSNITDDKRQISWEAGDVLPNPNGENNLLGDNVFMKTKRGEDYMRHNNIDSVGLLSIDTEGHEMEVLEGFGDKLRNVNMVQFEYGGTTYSAGHSMHDILAILKEHGFWGFGYLSMNRPYHGIIPMKWNENKTDHYAYCNIVCINKNFCKPGEQLTTFRNNNRFVVKWPE